MRDAAMWNLHVIASFLTESGVAAVRMMSPCGARRARHMPPHLLELAGPGEAVQEFAVDVADLQLHFVWEPMAAVEVPPRPRLAVATPTRAINDRLLATGLI